MKVRKLTKTQAEKAFGMEFKPGQKVGCQMDENDVYFLSESIITENENPELKWLSDLPKMEYVPRVKEE